MAAPMPVMEIAPAVLDPLMALVLSPGARILAFMWGALWASFGNVVIYRVPLGLSVVSPRSRCGGCETPIAAWDNIPIVSYLLLRGRCRHCEEPFALRYLVVEILGGLLAFALYLQLVHTPVLSQMVQIPAPPAGVDVVALLASWLMWFSFGLALLVITFIDLDAWIIPDVVVLPMAVVGVALAWLWPQVLGPSLLEAVLAGAAGYGLFAGIRLLYLKWRGIEALGLGDAKLLLMVGAFQGFPGLVWCIGAGAVQGLLISVPLLLLGKNVANADLHDVHGDDPELGEDDPDGAVVGQRVPFGPFLALAAMEYVLLRPTLDALLQGLVTP